LYKKQNFRDKPFPYHPQGHIRWQLFGPFFNQGKLDSTFVPEQTNFLNHNPIPNQEALGGTVVLRHWWSPVVKGYYLIHKKTPLGMLSKKSGCLPIPLPIAG
jgi:hypothetical protein